MPRRSGHRTGTRRCPARHRDVLAAGKTRKWSCSTLSPRAEVACERLRLVNAHIRITDHGGMCVGDVTPCDAHVAIVPGHANDMNDASIDIERPHARCHERTRLDFTTRGPQRYPAAVFDTFLHRQFRAELDKGLGLDLREPGHQA